MTARGQLLVSPCQPAFQPMRLPEPGTYVLSDQRRLRLSLSSEVSVSRQPHVATLDAAAVQFPLTIRTVAEGDRMQPFGMKGTKLLSDLMTDLGLSLLAKRRQLVVTDATGRIAALPTPSASLPTPASPLF